MKSLTVNECGICEFCTISLVVDLLKRCLRFARRNPENTTYDCHPSLNTGFGRVLISLAMFLFLSDQNKSAPSDWLSNDA